MIHFTYKGTRFSFSRRQLAPYVSEDDGSPFSTDNREHMEAAFDLLDSKFLVAELSDEVAKLPESEFVKLFTTT